MAESSAPMGAMGSTSDSAQSQADMSLANSQEVAQPDRSAEFDALINGDYKEEYGKRVADTVNKRLKSTKAENEQIKAKYDSLSPVLELLGQKYGADASDIDGLTKAILEDDTFYEDEALEQGVSVETLKQMKAMARENAALKKASEEAKQKEESNKFWGNLAEQGENVKQYYPGFDLEVELENPDFRRLVFGGVDAKAAYEAIHINEIVPALMSVSAQKAAQQVTNKIMANGSRPIENGLNGNGASVTKNDVASMSYAQMDDAIRRMRNGERITFN